MADILTKTEGVLHIARKAAEQTRRLKLANEKLESELKSMKQGLENEFRKNEELNNQIKIIKLAQNINSDQAAENGQVTELKRKINEYIREIDNCITMLND
jgi:nitrate/nitrite-specific signal transduction histidine kinase